ncbi:hypothetical protein GFB56_34860 [Ensifer sp. T173]|uniref:Thiopeptide-type bacteriocin biosynthesis domain-containing protein n=1 Tax=Ensifer canadensis TaxID=555315 RepID=A0AAW4FWR6_9HYPH|nr:lantibiotic dehydratase C-terminal domain-containing protein [Ensifer canadensis]MBM3095875.1 hypothetical protein [Ensifer canadensis]UBI81018.1 hypothetical protein J3R84_37960 [Ensifer canadensis]
MDILEWNLRPFLPEVIRYGEKLLDGFLDGFHFDSNMLVAHLRGRQRDNPGEHLAEDIFAYSKMVILYMEVRLSDDADKVFLLNRYSSGLNINNIYNTFKKYERPLARILVEPPSDITQDLSGPAREAIVASSPEQFRSFLHMSANRFIEEWSRELEAAGLKLAKRAYEIKLHTAGSALAFSEPNR